MRGTLLLFLSTCQRHSVEVNIYVYFFYLHNSIKRETPRSNQLFYLLLLFLYVQGRKDWRHLPLILLFCYVFHIVIT